MNSKVIRGIFVGIWKGPHILMTFVAGVALTLLAASAAMIGQSSAADAAAEIRATGTFTSLVSGPIAQYTPPLPGTPPPGNFSILSRYNLITWTGSLEGTGLSLQTITIDDVVARKAWLTNIATFFGTLNRSLPGSFSFTTHVVTDREACKPFLESGKPCPPSVTPAHGKVVVVEGTGQDGLEGICGGGTFERPMGEAVMSSYEFTFRFGKDCKAND